MGCPLKLALAAIAIARMLDAGTTCTAIGHGGTEANPVFPTSCRVAVSVQAGTIAAQDWALAKLHRTHPKLAQVIAWTTVGVESAIAYHNTGVR
jgi:hypothetical protein